MGSNQIPHFFKFLPFPREVPEGGWVQTKYHIFSNFFPFQGKYPQGDGFKPNTTFFPISSLSKGSTRRGMGSYYGSNKTTPCKFYNNKYNLSLKVYILKTNI
jgi:hypothetical protein